ncbi:pancreatic lipase-related protein 2-like [Cydia splendana]|uniref:pancreatic lipase-related protein 2-like n=1 Tax=Cydia splendana TaxID=1100963 RepID=UPI00212C73B8
MKWFVLISVAIAVTSASVIRDPTEGYQDGDRYFLFPSDDGDNVLHLVDTLEPIDEEFIRDYARNPDNNGYWLFTRANPHVAQLLLDGDVNSVIQSNFDLRKETVFLAHGWNGHGGNNMNTQLTEAFLQTADVNVIVLDWNLLANRSYITAKNGVAAVGRGLGHFISWLSNGFGLSLDRVHLVGFSLGGHLMGNAGRELQGQVKRITALDPAGPLWGSDSNRIAPTDARYVEVIHTNTAMFGYSSPCGHSDHYPNGGSSMPGCWLNSCSHSKAWEYMVATVKYDHLLGNECETQRDASRGRCSGELHSMGNGDINKQQLGIFRADTGRNYPY